ncbi:MAG TPA: hypothetical protein VGH48_17975 [Caldimonas sp.]
MRREPETAATYEAYERGFRWQCEAWPEPDVCVRQKFLALQERRSRQLVLNECAVNRGWAGREHDNAQCRSAPEPQTIVFRELLGTMTCTVAD